VTATLLRTTEATEGPSPSPSSARTSRGLLWGASAFIVLVVVLQAPGFVVHDTRLDLVLDPGRFVARIWDAWDPLVDMGRLRNQHAGYLFPMGPFYLFTDRLGVSPWLATRLWLAGVICVAMWGFARLCDVLAVGRPVVRFPVALAYAFSPFVLARVGNTSWFVLGAALVPWALVPLIRASRGGNVRRGAAAATVAVACAGGVNAAITVGMLGLPVIWLLTRERGRRRWQLALVFGLGVATVSLWWVVPLLLQRRYGFNFLPYTERAYTTTAYASPFEIVRGLGDWLSYTQVGPTNLAAGFELVRDGWLLLATGALASLGIYGLARRDLPERRFLVMSFTVGAVAIGAGRVGELGGPFAEQVRVLLDGPLSPLRTVYKLQPLVMLPLAIGMAHGASVLLDHLRPSPRSMARGLAPVALLAVVVVSAGPLVSGQLVNQQGFEEIPPWWAETASAVEDVPGRVLLAPGLSHADHEWGYTAEEPFQWLLAQPWATRNLAPLGSDQATVALDAIETASSQGGNPALPAFLARSGFSTVVVRNDGNGARYGAPDPQSYNQALLLSGLERTASFGPEVPAPVGALTPNIALSMMEVYSVPGYSSEGLVDASPTDTAAVVSGDASAGLVLEQFGLGHRTWIAATDLGSQPVPPQWIVTDTNRRRYTQFGLNRANGSHVLTPTEEGPNQRPLERGTLPGQDPADQTVAEMDGVASVDSSTYGSLFIPIPEAAPFSAIDGDPSTAWVPAAEVDPVDQYLQVEFEDPVDISEIELSLVDDGPWRSRLSRVEVVTDNGSSSAELSPGEGAQTVPVAPGPTTRLQVRIAAVDRQDTATSPPGIREIAIPGVQPRRRLVTPAQLLDTFSEPGAMPPTYLLVRSQVAPSQLVAQDEERQLARTIVVPSEGSFDLTVDVAPERNPELLNLVNRSVGLSIAANSTLGDLPRFAARNLLDDDPETLWLAGRPPTRAEPTELGSVVAPEEGVPWQDAGPSAVRVQWLGERTIDGLSLSAEDGFSRPTRVRVTTESGTRLAPVGLYGVVRFDPLVGDSVLIEFVDADVERGPDGDVRPIGLSNLDLFGVGDLVFPSVEEAPPVEVPCGAGPSLVVDGRPLELALSAPLEALVALRPIRASVCGGGVVDLPSGRVDVDAESPTGALSVSSVALSGSQTTPPLLRPSVDTRASSRTVTVESWDNVSRRVRIGPGEDSFLQIHENVNAGWVATLDGEELEPVTLEGWQQGYRLPAGDGGVVDLRFTPSTPYRAGLVAGMSALVLALLAAVVPGRPSRVRPVGPGRWPRLVPGAVVAMAVVSLAGVAAVGALGLAALRRWRVALIAPIAGLSYLAAAVVVAVSRNGELGGADWGALGVVPTALSLLAIFGVAVNLLQERTDEADEAAKADDEHDEASRDPTHG
jgi:arabinofuranan 3-O-arabinosyltransferase